MTLLSPAYLVFYHSFTKIASHMFLTLRGLASQKTHRGGPGFGGLVHEEAHPRFPYFVQTSCKRIDAGSTNCSLIQMTPSVNYSV